MSHMTEAEALEHALAKVRGARRPLKVAAGQLRMASQVLAELCEELDSLAARLERTAEEAEHDGNRDRAAAVV